MTRRTGEREQTTEDRATESTDVMTTSGSETLVDVGTGGTDVVSIGDSETLVNVARDNDADRGRVRRFRNLGRQSVEAIRRAFNRVDRSRLFRGTRSRREEREG